MRLLYLYPEPWTGREARERAALSTAAALAQSGMDVAFVTAGNGREWRRQLAEIEGGTEGLRLVSLAPGLGPIRSAAIFSSHLKIWLSREKPFEAAYISSLKAVPPLGVPYLYEAQEVFAEAPQKNPGQHRRIQECEKKVLARASWRVATSKPLAVALRAHYVLPDNFAAVPNAGSPPLAASVGAAGGPMVYGGSLAEGIETIIDASREARIPLRIIGDSAGEWKEFGGRVEAAHVEWHSRGNSSGAIAGARAGIVFIPPKLVSGRYACPLELFDYARCGLQVLSPALPALQSLEVGSWCMQVEKSTREVWVEALRQFRFNPVQAETARAWAGVHTWAHRAQALTRILMQKPRTAA